MARKSLTDMAARNAKGKEKSYKLSAGSGLYLLVMPNGSRYWRMKYSFAGKEKLLSIGVYPEITLKEAVEQRAAWPSRHICRRHTSALGRCRKAS
ncbi:Arm DNA-binding domain-containing protein [Stenotrophomonas sp. Y-13]|uniref:Arm DNA-binding domain-containing protein n=1 Tax=Stenotrophomonas sp. Y-13 TaxID=3384161 RepID=UPI00391730FC